MGPEKKLPPQNWAIDPNSGFPLYVQKVKWEKYGESVTLVLRTKVFFNVAVDVILDVLNIPDTHTLNTAMQYAPFEMCQSLCDFAKDIGTHGTHVIYPYAPDFPTQQDMGFPPYVKEDKYENS